ncbi:hypothetical protein M231_01478 [Tremella mesenterica]|uniref:Uncharacterized protein n=1 Tax=Tremella mesenterica TaxID=5217 RepID=A0A4Q1BTK2_TREME|nr:hypothetical protein M231_01478 [Tremella mesenterica]
MRSPVIATFAAFTSLAMGSPVPHQARRPTISLPGPLQDSAGNLSPAFASLSQLTHSSNSAPLLGPSLPSDPLGRAAAAVNVDMSHLASSPNFGSVSKAVDTSKFPHEMDSTANVLDTSAPFKKTADTTKKLDPATSKTSLQSQDKTKVLDTSKIEKMETPPKIIDDPKFSAKMDGDKIVQPVMTTPPSDTNVVNTNQPSQVDSTNVEHPKTPGLGFGAFHGLPKGPAHKRSLPPLDGLGIVFPAQEALHSLGEPALRTQGAQHPQLGRLTPETLVDLEVVLKGVEKAEKLVNPRRSRRAAMKNKDNNIIQEDSLEKMGQMGDLKKSLNGLNIMDKTEVDQVKKEENGVKMKYGKNPLTKPDENQLEKVQVVKPEAAAIKPIDGNMYKIAQTTSHGGENVRREVKGNVDDEIKDTQKKVGDGNNDTGKKVEDGSKDTEKKLGDGNKDILKNIGTGSQESQAELGKGVKGKTGKKGKRMLEVEYGKMWRGAKELSDMDDYPFFG